jgi:hypothetical protein
LSKIIIFSQNPDGALLKIFFVVTKLPSLREFPVLRIRNFCFGAGYGSGLHQVSDPDSNPDSNLGLDTDRDQAKLQKTVLRIRIRSGAFLTPGSGKGKKSRSGSGMKISDHISES